jgi:peptide-methionine (S)-S-oxide reductase
MKQFLQSTLWVFVLSCLNVSYAEGEAMKPTMKTQEAIFAMGCFWCGAAAFADHDTNEKLPGIIAIRSGYTGGTSTNPIYPAHEGHQEAVKVVFDPDQIPYETVLDIFWHNIDPFDGKGQFCDKGDSYKAVIFYKDDAQKKSAFASKKAIEMQLGKSVVTEIKAATPFYDAEDYHQDYKRKNPVRYKVYRWNCGRDQRLSEIWKK